MRYLLIVALSFFFMFSVNAAIIQWSGGVSQDWHNSANWSSNQVPTSADDVVIVGTTTPVEILSANAQAKSLTMDIAQLDLANSRSLVVAGINPLYPTSSVHLNQSTITNSGVIDITGAMYTNNSTIINNNGIFLNGSQDNTPISLELDNNSTLTNTAIFSFVTFTNNFEPGTGLYKQVFLKINNSSTVFINNGYMNSLTEWADTGIEINNSSTLINNSLIHMQTVKIYGIHIKNDLGIAPFSSFENHSTLRLFKCTTCNYGEVTCGIRVEENAKYNDYPTTSTVVITDFTDVNDSDVCVYGTVGTFGSLSGSAVDLGNYMFDPLATLQGTGVIIIDNGLNAGFTATIFPGGPQVGKMIIQGDFTSTTSTVFKMKIEGNGEAGMMTGHDQIDWGEDETSLSMSTLKVDLTNGFVPDVGDQFQIFIGSVEGEFDNLDLPGGNDSWQVNYDPNGVMLEVIAPINNVNNAGIGTLAPRTKLEINGGDILLSSIGTGVVLTSPGGQFYKVTVDDNGELQTELIPCPEVWECP